MCVNVYLWGVVLVDRAERLTINSDILQYLLSNYGIHVFHKFDVLAKCDLMDNVQ